MLSKHCTYINLPLDYLPFNFPAGQQVGQPMGMNTISPPAQRPAPSHGPHSMAPPQVATTTLGKNGEPVTPTALQQQFSPPGSGQNPQQQQTPAGQRPIMGSGGGGGKGVPGAQATPGSGQQMVDTVRLAEQARMAQIQAQLQAQGQHLGKCPPIFKKKIGKLIMPVVWAPVSFCDRVFTVFDDRS